MSTDCLVLLIEDSVMYMNLFILYDDEKKSFFLCGKKITSTGIDYTPFSFQCENEKVVKQFTRLIMEDTVNMYLYNFNNLPRNCDDISFNTLYEMKSEECELSTYFEEEDYYNDMTDYLEMLKNIKNYYIR
jgi:hypothetical protein